MNRGKRKRKQNVREIAPESYLIVCEGETEKQYFEAIIKKIEGEREQRFPAKIIAAGANTKSLVVSTKDEIRRASIVYSNVWCVFDKDDFPDGNFNSEIEKAEKEGYGAAWSNEAFELWFLLHFQLLTTKLTRGQYNKKLNEIYRTKSIGELKYKKNDPNIYDILEKHGSVRDAIRNAKKLKKQNANTVSNAKKNPETTVFVLVEKLLKYLSSK